MPQTPSQITNNLVEIINYTSSESDAKQTKQDLISRENCEVKMIPQSQLAEKFLNWSWIRWSQKDLDFYEKYLQNSEPINDVYGNNIESEKKWGARFWFDGGVDIEKQMISKEKLDYIVFDSKKNNSKKYHVNGFTGYYSDKLPFKVPKGRQGISTFNQQYKIIWGVKDPTNFQFSNLKLLLNGLQSLIISSNNKVEIVYIFAILNSNLNRKVLEINCKSKHEQSFFVSMTNIKNFIRVPILDTPQKIEQKQKLIQLAQELLDAETVALQDLVDFDDDRVLPARFEKWEVSNGDTVIASTIILDSTYKFPIKNQPDLIKQTLEKEIGNSEFSLNQLKNLNVFDKNHQSRIKNQIDELVLEMYQLPAQN